MLRNLLFLLTVLSFTAAAYAAPYDVGDVELKVGDRAPAWTLTNMLGNVVSSESYKQRPAVLVMGTAREAAHACREWMLTLYKNTNGTATVTYQVIILNNPWYIPNFAVINELKDFIPEYGHHLVMLEWESAWGVLYGIPYDLEPRIMVLDRDGIIRLRHTGNMTDEALIEVLNLVDALNR